MPKDPFAYVFSRIAHKGFKPVLCRRNQRGMMYSAQTSSGSTGVRRPRRDGLDTFFAGFVSVPSRRNLEEGPRFGRVVYSQWWPQQENADVLLQRI